MEGEPLQSVAAVIFDFGGVISKDPFTTLASAAANSGLEFSEFAAIAVGHGHYGDGDHPWHRLERGEIDLDAYNQAVDGLAKARGHDGFPPLPVDLILSRALEVRPAMLELLHDLRKQGIVTAILTNSVRAVGAWRDSAEWDQIVDVVVDSSEVGMRKPERRIFDHTLAALGVTAAETAFLDDMQVNVDAAAGMGLTGVLVTDPAEAIATVRRLVQG